MSTKIDPGDLDLTSSFDGPTFDGLPDIKKVAIKGLLAGKKCQPNWSCDSYPLPVYPPGHPLRGAYEAYFRYWITMWGRARAGPAKGFLELV